MSNIWRRYAPKLFDVVIIYPDTHKIVLEDVKYIPLIVYRDSIELMLKVDSLIHSFLNKVYKVGNLISKLVNMSHMNVETLLSFHSPCRECCKLRLIEDLTRERFCFSNIVYKIIRERFGIAVKYRIVNLYKDIPEI